MKELQQQRRKAVKATDKQIIGIKWHQKLIKRGGEWEGEESEERRGRKQKEQREEEKREMKY